MRLKAHRPPPFAFVWQEAGSDGPGSSSLPGLTGSGFTELGIAKNPVEGTALVEVRV